MRRARSVLAALAAASLACAAAPAPREHFYRLRAAAPPRVLDAPALTGTLEVGALRADGLVRERGLLFSEHERPLEIRRYRYHHWTEPPVAMIQEQLASYLRAGRLADLVVTPEVRTQADYTVSGRIHRLERVLGSDPANVLVEIEFEVSRRAGSQLLWSATYAAERPDTGERVGDAVVAFNEALGDVFARLFTDLVGVGSRQSLAGGAPGDRP